MHEIVEWKTIKDDFRDGLLLGNGASMAVHKNFSYTSLFQKATDLKHISEEVKQIFKKFDTEDFELVLRHLWHAKLVNETLKITANENEIEIAYKQVQDALIQTIQKTHPTYEDIEAHLIPIYQFMLNFKTILSLNYDLIVYWATLLGNDALGGNYFKDGFTNNRGLADDIDALRNSYPPATTSTLFFYPHGNIVLARTADGGEEKIKCVGPWPIIKLLDTVLTCWKEYSSPIFICEGETEHKKSSIKNASYLTRVYHEVIPSISDSLVIYGWSISEKDNHIMAQLKRKKPLRVAVSVHDNNQDYAANAKKTLAGQDIKDVTFFRSDSSGCWNNPNSEDKK